MPSPLLHTDDLLRWRACARQQWWHRREPDAGWPAAIDRDEESWPGDALKASYPEALVLGRPTCEADWQAAMTATWGWLGSPRSQVPGAAVLGACLQTDDGLRVCIDVLERGEHGWRLLRRRLATAGDEADVDAMATWVHAASRAGLRVQAAGLLLVDTDFVYPGHGCYAGLFREVDLRPQLGNRDVPAWLVACRRGEQGAEPPATFGPACSRPVCPRAHACEVPAPWRGDRRDDPASLSVLGREAAQALREEGWSSLLDVPEDRITEPRRRRMWRAVRQGGLVVEPDAAAALSGWPGPRRFLRIDTLGFAVPLWAGTRPYQMLPYQWSCATETAPGSVRQAGFLASPGSDPRPAFVRSLLAELQGSGPILAYNAGFERNRLRELAEWAERCSEASGPVDAGPAAELTALLPRIVDLFQLMRAGCYHPAMCGSWSFASVASALAPEQGYDAARSAALTQAYALTLQDSRRAGVPASLAEALRERGQHETAVLRRLLAVLASGEGQAVVGSAPAADAHGADARAGISPQDETAPR